LLVILVKTNKGVVCLPLLMVKAIIFDSSVLIDIPKDKMRLALSKIVSYYFEPDKFLSDYAKAFKSFQKGLFTEVDFFTEVFKDYDIPMRTVKKVIDTHNSERDKLVKIRRNVMDTVKALSPNYKLGILSNMPREWFLRDAKRLGINLSFFNEVLFASDFKCVKPDKKCFIGICKALKLKPADCVFVTNHEIEATGAGNAGLSFITLGIPDSDFSIDSIAELVTMFEPSNDNIKQLHEVNMP